MSSETPIRARSDVDLPGPFRVGEREIETVCRSLGMIGAVKISAACNDRTTRVFSSLSQLFSYANPEAKQIFRLTLAARSTDYTQQGEVVFNSQWSGGISFSVEAPDDTATLLKGQLLDVLHGVRPWYAVLHKLNFARVFLGVLLAFVALLAAIVFAKYNPSSAPPEPKPFSTYVRAGLYMAAFPIAGEIANALRDAYFPARSILIGQATERDKKLDHLQKVVVIPLVVGVVGFGINRMYGILQRAW